MKINFNSYFSCTKNCRLYYFASTKILLNNLADKTFRSMSKGCKFNSRCNKHMRNKKWLEFLWIAHVYFHSATFPNICHGHKTVMHPRGSRWKDIIFYYGIWIAVNDNNGNKKELKYNLQRALGYHLCKDKSWENVSIQLNV